MGSGDVPDVIQNVKFSESVQETMYIQTYVSGVSAGDHMTHDHIAIVSFANWSLLETMPGSTPNIQFDLSDNNVKNNHNDDRDVDEIVIDVGSPDTSFTSRPAPMLRDAKSEHELAESLRYINPFLAKRHADMQHPVYMREIMSSGSVCSLELSLRSLQGYVNRIAKVVDVGERGSLSLSRQSFAQSLSFKSPNRLSPMQQAGKMKFNRSNSVEVDDKLSGAIYLRIRDLRRLDFNLNPSEEPSFWVRKHAIMISIDPIRAVVMASRIIIIVPPGGMDKILDILERHLADCTADFRSSGKLSHNSLNADENEGQDEDMNQFEFTAIEAILATVSTLHNQQLKAMSDDATEALSYFDATSSISVILPFAVQVRGRSAYHFPPMRPFPVPHLAPAYPFVLLSHSHSPDHLHSSLIFEPILMPILTSTPHPHSHNRPHTTPHTQSTHLFHSPPLRKKCATSRTNCPSCVPV